VIRRLLALAFVAWFLGLVLFAIFLPGPSDIAKTDAVVVLTGGVGRFERGLETLQEGKAKRMLVSGVDPSVRRAEFEVLRKVPAKISRCCIDLDKASVDTILAQRRGDPSKRRSLDPEIIVSELSAERASSRLIAERWNMQLHILPFSTDPTTPARLMELLSYD
jgi:hypothetical protein